MRYLYVLVLFFALSVYGISASPGNHITFTLVKDNGIAVPYCAFPEFNESLPPDITVECDAIPDIATITAKDNCGNPVVVVFNEVNNDDGSCKSYTIVRNWSAQDNIGNRISHTQTITVQDTTPPYFIQSLPTNETVACGEVPDAPTITAADACDKSVCVVDFNEVITGQDDSCAANYSITRTWSTKDCADNSISHTQIITVEDTTPPYFIQSLPSDETVACGAVPDTPIITAADACDKSVCVVDFNEAITGQDDGCAANYTITRTWSTKDCADNSISHTQIITVEDTTPPYFIQSLPADETVACGAIPDAPTITAADACDKSVCVVDFNEAITGQDDGCAANYTITRTWSTKDCSDNSISHTQIITVEDTTPPYFIQSLPTDETVACDEVPDAPTITAADACDKSVCVVDFNEVITGQDDGCAANYSITRTWSTKDCADNSISHTQIITVEDTEAPSFVEELPADINTSCDAIPDMTLLSAADNCDISAAVVSAETITHEDPNCSDQYTITRKWTATDCVGNETTHTQTIMVIDEEAPVFSGTLPSDIALNCTEIPEMEILTATDSCSDQVTITMSETSDKEGDCDTDYSISRTWNAMDCAGNNTSHTQLLTVTNGESAFVEMLPANISISCSEIPEPAVLTATDGCGNQVDVSFSENSSQTDTSCETYDITRTWTAIICGDNFISHSQTITVNPGEVSFNETLPENISIDCANIPDAAVLTANDGCGNDISVAFEETSTQTDNCTSYDIVRSWSILNCNNETLSHTQKITVNPGEVSFTGELPADISLQCEEVPDAAIIIASDACGNPIEVLFEENSTQTDDACMVYTITRSWTLANCEGNELSHTQTISVGDTEAPSLLSDLEADVSVNCGGEIPDIPNLEFEDNCTAVDAITVDYSEAEETVDNGNLKITRTWMVSDSCSNSATYIQTITVGVDASETESKEYESCINDGTIDLLSLFDNADPNGVWEDLDNSGALSGNIFDTFSVGVGSYRFILRDGKNNCSLGKEVTIILNNDCEVLPCHFEDLEISKAVTPNGDGYNDFFEVKGIEECGFRVHLKMYNRWGHLIYESKDYQNDWDGFSSNGQLPAGSYFYIINIIDSGFGIIDGYIYLGTGA